MGKALGGNESIVGAAVIDEKDLVLVRNTGHGGLDRFVERANAVLLIVQRYYN